MSEEQLKNLDFSPRIVCDVSKVVWTARGATLDPVTVSAHNSDGCSEEAKYISNLRVCPCWADPALVLKNESSWFYWGLPVLTIFMCPSHLSYFTEQLKYPFLCPTCKVGFQSVGEMILRVSEIPEA